MGLRLALRSRVAWLAAPWVHPSVFVPIIVAFAVPALFLASAQRLEHAAADAVASQIVQDVPSPGLGLAVEAAGALVPDRVDQLGQALERRFSDLPEVSVW